MIVLLFCSCFFFYLIYNKNSLVYKYSIPEPCVVHTLLTMREKTMRE